MAIFEFFDVSLEMVNGLNTRTTIRSHHEGQLQGAGPPHPLPGHGGRHVLLAGLRLRERRRQLQLYHDAGRLLVGLHHNDHCWIW